MEINILADGKLAFWAVTCSFIFFAGSSMILVLARILSVSPELVEAARIDGAKNWQINVYILLPLLRPIIGTIAILQVNYALLLYNEIALISGGGPDKATYSLSYLIFQKAMGSTRLNFAEANTVGVIQFLLGIVMVGIISRVFSADRTEG
jgi:ABC-type sugar transport system permease subunit